MDGNPMLWRSNPLLWSAALGVAALLFGVGSLFGASVPGMGWSVPDLLRYALPAAALVLLRWRPELTAARLLVAAGACAIPLPVVALTGGGYPDLLGDLLAYATVAAAVLLPIGVLGAAVDLTRRGTPGPAALVGVVVIGPVLAPSFLFGTVGFRHLDVLAVLALLAAAATVVTGLLALRLAPPAEPPPAARQRDWRVVVAGGLAAMAPALYPLGVFTPFAATAGSEHLRMVAVFGLIALVTGALAGRRAGLAAFAVGLLVGACQAVLTPALSAVDSRPATALAAMVAGMALGGAAAVSRWRARIGAAGVVAVAVVLGAVFVAGGRDLDSWVTPVLLVVGIAAGVALTGAVAVAALGVDGDTPAVFAGLIVPVVLAVAHLAAYGKAATADGMGYLVPVVVALLVAGAFGRSR